MSNSNDQERDNAPAELPEYERLETREELHLINEELATVNERLKEKLAELQRTRNDIENFFASTNLATIFLDSQFRIKRYTPAAGRLLHVGPQDIGRPLQDIACILIDEDTIDEAQKVFESLEAAEQEIRTGDGRWFLRKILPYRTENHRIDGIVLTFSDITELKRTTRKIKIRERQNAAVAKLGLEALNEKNIDMFMEQVVREVVHTLDAHYCKILEHHPEDRVLLLKAGVGWKEGLVGKITMPDEFGSQGGYTLKERHPVIVDDLRTEKRFPGPALLLDHDVISGMTCIIGNEKNPYGVIGVHTRDKRNFTRDDANFLAAVANLLAGALQREQDRKSLQESESKLRIATSAHKMGIHDYDIRTGLIEWDSILKEIWGIDEKKVMTIETFFEGLHPDDKKKTRRALDKALDPAGDGHYYATYRVISQKTDKLSWVEASGQIIFENGEPVRLIGMVVDITERKNLEQSLQTAIEELELADIRKNEFLATLGHELRNPLAAINSGVQIMQISIEDSKWALDMMAKNVGLIASLLDDLLDLTRISRGKIKLDKSILKLNTVLQETLKSFAPKVAEKNQKLETQLTDEPLYMFGDATRMGQIFANLLTNAHKFTQEGGRIRVSLERGGDNKAVIKVEDNGMGIRGEKLKKIFEPFEQIAPAGNTNTGLGIGLSLVQQFIRMHGGVIQAESQGEGKGCTFTIMLPLAQEVSLPAQEQKASRPRLKKDLRVLIVDDNQDAARGLKFRLEKEGCKTIAAYTARSAIEKLNDFDPEALILDIGLPDMTGHELVREIRKKYRKDALYIAVTGFGHEEAQKESRAAGFDFHLNKPANFENLLEILGAIRA